MRFLLAVLVMSVVTSSSALAQSQGQRGDNGGVYRSSAIGQLGNATLQALSQTGLVLGGTASSDGVLQMTIDGQYSAGSSQGSIYMLDASGAVVRSLGGFFHDQPSVKTVDVWPLFQPRPADGMYQLTIGPQGVVPTPGSDYAWIWFEVGADSSSSNECNHDYNPTSAIDTLQPLDAAWGVDVTATGSLPANSDVQARVIGNGVDETVTVLDVDPSDPFAGVLFSQLPSAGTYQLLLSWVCNNVSPPSAGEVWNFNLTIAGDDAWDGSLQPPGSPQFYVLDPECIDRDGEQTQTLTFRIAGAENGNANFQDDVYLITTPPPVGG
ncbi:MAG: hypothetical protein AAGG01_00880, partial [Planctomycetota bacterium]